MPDQEKDIRPAASKAAVERLAGKTPAQAQQETIARLAKYGGFSLAETSIEGAQNLNPERKARKHIFLEDEEYKAEREALKSRLRRWRDLLENHGSIADMVADAEQKGAAARQLLHGNLARAIEKTKNLERNWRTLQLFYNNTERVKVKNVTVVNASMSQLTDLDTPRFINYVAEELNNNFDRLDLRDNYSLLVLPGYIGSNKVLEKWANIAYENKVMLVTDFRHLESPDDVMEMFQKAHHTGGDAFRANVMMTCNWLVGREKYEELGEEEELFVPSSAALAGRIYATLLSQVAAGKKFGGIREVDGVKFDLKKSEISDLEKLGLVPMVKEYGKVMAFSAKTLFNGDNVGLQTYSVVRVFDWVLKVLMDFLNRRAFENFTADTKNDLRDQIIRFLDKIKGPKRLIEDFKFIDIYQDPVDKTTVHLNIHLTPYFPARTFMIQLSGTKGDSPEKAKWKISDMQTVER